MYLDGKSASWDWSVGDLVINNDDTNVDDVVGNQHLDFEVLGYHADMFEMRSSISIFWLWDLE